MDESTTDLLRGQLHDRRARLREAVRSGRPEDDLVRLLQQVDAALARIDADLYGVCEVCHEDIDTPDLLANPLVRYCLCRLTPQQLSLLQNDLDLAGRIQAGLLPPPDVELGGWQVHYRYEPLGPVSGDTCDVLATGGPDDHIFFSLGDVSGKGVAASLLMSHLNASFRSLVGLGLPVAELVARADQMLQEKKLQSHYATLVAGIARRGGEVELCNAGHCPPLVVRRNGHEPEPPNSGRARSAPATGDNGFSIERLGATGFPLGMVAGQNPEPQRLRLDDGETIVLYTDGLPEARNSAGEEYGIERIAEVASRAGALPPRALAGEILAGLRAHLGGAAREDDLTLMVVRRVADLTGRS